jgi:hypothetical protein
MNAPTSEERAAGEVEAIVDGEVGISHAPHEMEDEEERHRPREPLVCILQSLNSACRNKHPPCQVKLTPCRPKSLGSSLI